MEDINFCNVRSNSKNLPCCRDEKEFRSPLTADSVPSCLAVRLVPYSSFRLAAEQSRNRSSRSLLPGHVCFIYCISVHKSVLVERVVECLCIISRN